MLDRAKESMLQRQGLKGGDLPETYNITHLYIVLKIHNTYNFTWENFNYIGKAGGEITSNLSIHTVGFIFSFLLKNKQE
jgi:hypothetical protein